MKKRFLLIFMYILMFALIYSKQNIDYKPYEEIYGLSEYDIKKIIGAYMFNIDCKGKTFGNTWYETSYSWGKGLRVSQGTNISILSRHDFSYAGFESYLCFLDSGAIRVIKSIDKINDNTYIGHFFNANAQDCSKEYFKLKFYDDTHLDLEYTIGLLRSKPVILSLRKISGPLIEFKPMAHKIMSGMDPYTDKNAKGYDSYKELVDERSKKIKDSY